MVGIGVAVTVAVSDELDATGVGVGVAVKSFLKKLASGGQMVFHRECPVTAVRTMLMMR